MMKGNVIWQCKTRQLGKYREVKCFTGNLQCTGKGIEYTQIKKYKVNTKKGKIDEIQVNEKIDRRKRKPAKSIVFYRMELIEKNKNLN